MFYKTRIELFNTNIQVHTCIKYYLHKIVTKYFYLSSSCFTILSLQGYKSDFRWLAFVIPLDQFHDAGFYAGQIYSIAI